MQDADAFEIDALKLAADAGIDVRTARRALREGVDALKGLVLRQRVRVSAERLGLSVTRIRTKKKGAS
jgi:hypothetical protein